MALTNKSITSRLGYQQITALTSATSLTVPQVDLNGLSSKPMFAVIIAETQAVRWRDDGVAPTATVGMPLAVNTPYVYDGDIGRIQFIEQVASAKLNITYYA